MSVTEKDLKCCKVISASITDIIRRSLNEEFRQKCFQILETTNTFGVETNVNSLLLEIMTAKFQRKAQRGTTKAEVSKEDFPSTNTSTRGPTELTVRQKELDDCLIPDDINLEEIDNWD